MDNLDSKEKLTEAVDSGKDSSVLENHKEEKQEEKVISEPILEEEKLSPEERVFVDEMVSAGVWHGRKHSKLNPKMAKYIIGTRRGVDVIDLLKTRELLDSAIDFLKGLIKEKKTVLVVGTKPATGDLAKNLAEKFGWSYVTERWLGGTLTNFRVISKRIEYFKKLRADKESGDLSKYTKKEQLMATRELDKLSRNLSGIEKMSELPEAVVVVNVASHPTALREANRLNIPVVGIMNTDSDPDKVECPIVANDNARSSVKWVLDELKEKLEGTEVVTDNE